MHTETNIEGREGNDGNRSRGESVGRACILGSKRYLTASVFSLLRTRVRIAASASVHVPSDSGRDSYEQSR